MIGQKAHRLLLFILLAAGLCAAGCASGSRGAKQDATGGLSLKLYVKQGQNSFARYRLEPDGTLHYGGGRDARDDKYSWSGPMTGEEIASLRDLLEQHDWFRIGLPSTGEPPDQLWEVTIRIPRLRQHFKVKGASPELASVHELLETAARRRHEDFLQSLPQPGPR